MTRIVVDCDGELVAAAMAATGLPTRESTVEEALRRLIRKAAAPAGTYGIGAPRMGRRSARDARGKAVQPAGVIGGAYVEM